MPLLKAFSNMRSMLEIRSGSTRKETRPSWVRERLAMTPRTRLECR